MAKKRDSQGLQSQSPSDRGSGGTQTHVMVKPPNIQTAVFQIEGTAPLVIHRFGVKAKQSILAKMMAGQSARGKKIREPLVPTDTMNAGRYIAREGWDGINAASIRSAMISACRLVGYKMTLAKMSIFVLPDGWDALEPQIPLVRIEGKAEKLEAMARVETGQVYISIRPLYNPWKAKVTIQFDADQFTVTDVANLLSRVGMQVGIGEGRPDSKNSPGQGWGTFRVLGGADKDKEE